VLGRGSGGDKGRGLVPIHVGSRHLIRVLEAEVRKLERAPLSRQVIVAISRNYIGSRLKMDAHRSSLRPSPRERTGGCPLQSRGSARMDERGTADIEAFFFLLLRLLALGRLLRVFAGSPSIVALTTTVLGQ
jgi:hypothetical protein